MKMLLAAVCLTAFVTPLAFAESKIELDAKVQEARSTFAKP